MLLDCLVSLLSPGPQMSQVITILPSRLRPWVRAEFADRSVVLHSTSKVAIPKGGDTCHSRRHLGGISAAARWSRTGTIRVCTRWANASDSVVYIGSSDA